MLVWVGLFSCDFSVLQFFHLRFAFVVDHNVVAAVIFALCLYSFFLFYFFSRVLG